MTTETGSVQVSCIADLVSVFVKLFEEHSPYEIFSDFGLEQLRLLVDTEDLPIGTGFSYQLSDWTKLRAISHPFVFQTKTEESGSVRLEYREDSQLAGWVKVYARDGSGCLFIDVETTEHFRRRGIATALVHNATRLILEQGKIARYGAAKSNFSSLRIAKRLGYVLCSQHIVG